jgi:molecular chaperone GrpE (heat shock protein)
MQPGIAGVIEGYELAIRRCDRMLAQFGVHAVPTVAARFDARTMHAVETRRVADREDGVVVDEFVSGFVRDGEVLRLAEVAVNRVQGGE